MQTTYRCTGYNLQDIQTQAARGCIVAVFMTGPDNDDDIVIAETADELSDAMQEAADTCGLDAIPTYWKMRVLTADEISTLTITD